MDKDEIKVGEFYLINMNWWTKGESYEIGKVIDIRTPRGTPETSSIGEYVVEFINEVGCHDGGGGRKNKRGKNNYCLFVWRKYFECRSTEDELMAWLI